MTSSDVAEPSTVRTLDEVKTSSVQPASLNRRKVTVPVGRTAPTRLAVALTGVPTGPPADAAARMPGVRLTIVRLKVWHAGADTPLLPQTVVGPKVPAEAGAPVTKPVGARVNPGGSTPSVTEKLGSGVWGEVVNWWT